MDSSSPRTISTSAVLESLLLLIEIKMFAFRHIRSVLFSGLCGILFPNKRESAFASLRMYESIGFTISAAYAQFLCMDVKMYITGSVLLVSVIGYFIMESVHEQEKRLKKKPVSFVWRNPSDVWPGYDVIIRLRSHLLTPTPRLMTMSESLRNSVGVNRALRLGYATIIVQLEIPLLCVQGLEESQKQTYMPLFLYIMQSHSLRTYIIIASFGLLDQRTGDFPFVSSCVVGVLKIPQVPFAFWVWVGMAKCQLGD